MVCQSSRRIVGLSLPLMALCESCIATRRASDARRSFGGQLVLAKLEDLDRRKPCLRGFVGGNSRSFLDDVQRIGTAQGSRIGDARA